MRGRETARWRVGVFWALGQGFTGQRHLDLAREHRKHPTNSLQYALPKGDSLAGTQTFGKTFRAKPMSNAAKPLRVKQSQCPAGPLVRTLHMRLTPRQGRVWVQRKPVTRPFFRVLIPCLLKLPPDLSDMHVLSDRSTCKASPERLSEHFNGFFIHRSLVVCKREPGGWTWKAPVSRCHWTLRTEPRTL